MEPTQKRMGLGDLVEKAAKIERLIDANIRLQRHLTQHGFSPTPADAEELTALLAFASNRLIGLRSRRATVYHLIEVEKDRIADEIRQHKRQQLNVLTFTRKP